MDEKSLNNNKYLEWCKQREIFNNLSITNQKIKTPTRNEMQNLFLDEEIILKLLKFLHKKSDNKDLKYEFGEVEFEGIFDWTVIISDSSCTKLQYEYNEFDKNERKYTDEYKLTLGNVYIEIEPLLGDDYPCVLRKIKYKKELTSNSLKQVKEPCNFVLLIKKYDSLITPTNTLKYIFKKSGIDVVFLNELLKTSP